MKAKNTHGGARPGSGPKPKHAERMVRHNVMLDADTVEGARAIGDGNLSEGIRVAVAKAMKSWKYTKRLNIYQNQRQTRCDNRLNTWGG